MAKFKAKTNFFMAKTGQQFDEGVVYEMTSAEADEINKKTVAHYKEVWLDCVEQDSLPFKPILAEPEMTGSFE